MLEENKDNSKERRDPNEIRGVTVEKFKVFFSKLEDKKELPCAVCGGTLWDIPCSPNDETHPNVITLPMPFSPGFGVWAFHIVCDGCGNMMFFEASKVVDALRETGEL